MNICRKIVETHDIPYVELESYGFGDEDIAIPIRFATRVIDILQQEVVPILGGDLLRYENGEIEFTYDNWSCEIIHPFSVFVTESCDVARKNITEYLFDYKNETNSIYVNFVLYNERT